jgi:hypothetical protein
LSICSTRHMPSAWNLPPQVHTRSIPCFLRSNSKITSGAASPP